MKKKIKIIIKRIFEIFGYSIKKNYLNREVFEFPRDFFPIEMSQIQKKIIRNSEEYSMTGRIRMSLLLKLIENLYNNNIDGDIVECGVWKGGNLICAQKYLNYLKINKKIIGFDTFYGMTKETKHDEQIKQVSLNINGEKNYTVVNRKASDMMKSIDKHVDDGKNIWAFCSQEEVEKNIKKECTNNNIRLVKGSVEKTLLEEKNLPDKISLLRLDTDFYESTKIELEILYPRLINGGFLIIDDYGHWKGCRKAVDEYFNGKNPFIHCIDENCRLIVKNA